MIHINKAVMCFANFALKPLTIATKYENCSETGKPTLHRQYHFCLSEKQKDK